MTHVHFWTRRPEAMEPWDPDTEPDRHANGFGHAFLELYCRLRQSGHPVTLGPDVDRASTAVVVSLEEIHEWQDRIPPRLDARLALSLLRARRSPAVILLRVDRPITVNPPSGTTIEVMPTRASITRASQVWLPMLPQRALIPRDTARGSTVQMVVLKAYSYNVPEWMDRTFEEELTRLGLQLRIDDEHSGRWPDFRDVDVVLCTQRRDSLGDPRRKPPTKLINAWRAGVIPVCGDHVGYRELGDDGTTMLLVDDTDPSAVLSALRRLAVDTELVGRMRAAIPQDDFTPEAVMRQHWQVFESAPRSRRSAVVLSLFRSLPAEAIRRARRRFRLR